MKKFPAKILILIMAIAIILVVGAGSFALAYWSASPQVIVDGGSSTEVDNSENATTKYLIFKPIGNFDDDYCFEYSDTTGWTLKYEYGDDYILNGGANAAGSRVALDEEDETEGAIMDAIQTALTAPNNKVKVIGYIGSLGQYENLVIPSTITWGELTLNVTEVDIKMTEYEEPMNLITGVEIPSSITAISGASFSGAYNLIKVYFKGTLPTIGTYCFRGMNSSIVYYDSTNTPIANIRA